jgi:hypothetical protein
MNIGMSAIGPKRTSLVALHMSAFGGKADIGVFGLFIFFWYRYAFTWGFAFIVPLKK